MPKGQRLCTHTKIMVLKHLKRGAPIKEIQFWFGLSPRCIRRWRKKYNLVEHLGDALVSRQRHPQGSYEACVRRGNMHDCRGKPWENVRADWHHVGGSPRRCFVLHPYPDHGAVKILWRQVPLESQLVLFSGFTLEAARNEQGADCEVRVFIANELVAEWTEAKNGWGFVRHVIETDSWSGRPADIEIQVASRDEDFRDLCFDGHVVSR